MHNRELKPLYAMMVTGKDPERIEWARHQVVYFLQQMRYPEHLKHVLIANEHPSLTVLCGDSSFNNAQCKEMQITNRAQTTLGDIRNRLLACVPPHSYCFPLDDDDYLSPDWIYQMLQHWPNNETALVQFGARLNHNLISVSSWQSHFDSGFVHYVADIDRLRAISFQYASQNTLEDLVLHRLQIGQQRHLWLDNDASLYIRYVHHTNTSVFVNANQTAANDRLGEREVTKSQHELCITHAPNRHTTENPTVARFTKWCRTYGSFAFVGLCCLVLYAHYRRRWTAIDK